MRVQRKWRLFSVLVLGLGFGCGEDAGGSLKGVDAGTVPGSTAGTSGATAGSSGTGTVGVAGTSGSNGDDAGAIDGSLADAATDGSVDASTEPPRMPPCVSKASQVIVVGDSYINYTADQDLVRRMALLARADGALGASETWRSYAQPGWSLGSGGFGLIPTQLDQGLAIDPDIKASVMDGGGNDVLIPWGGFLAGGDQCKESAQSPSLKICQDIVDTAIAAGEKMMMTAAAAGIEDVVYFFYPHLPGGGLSGANPNIILDYAYPKAQELCDSAAKLTSGKTHCHFIDTRPIFAGKNWISGDGIHPTADGSDAIAAAVWKVMKDKCIGQHADSGCCTP